MFSSLKATGRANFGRQEISTHIIREASRFWDDSAIEGDILAKITHAQPLTEKEQDIFIHSEAENIGNIRATINGTIGRLEAAVPDYITRLVGFHAHRAASESAKVTKFLIGFEPRERFYVDLFYFGPRAETAKHAHNAHCVSFQLLGNLREAVYRPKAYNWQEVAFKDKRKGETTIVSPYDGDDIHAIINDSKTPAATMHIYGQRLLGDDGIVVTNRSAQALGPTAVTKYLSGISGYTLALSHNADPSARTQFANRR